MAEPRLLPVKIEQRVMRQKLFLKFFSIGRGQAIPVDPGRVANEIIATIRQMFLQSIRGSVAKWRLKNRVEMNNRQFNFRQRQLKICRQQPQKIQAGGEHAERIKITAKNSR